MPRLAARLAILILTATAVAFAAGGAVAESQGLAPVSEAPSICTLNGSAAATPSEVVAGDTVDMRLELTGTCPQGAGAKADILLLLDRSSSMGEDGKLEAAHAAVRGFVDRVDFQRHRVGLVPFTSHAYVLQTLTSQPDLILAALERSGEAEQATNIARAIQIADQELDAVRRPEAVGVIILLTDGQSNADAMVAAAGDAAADGTVIFAVALGPDADRSALRRVASSEEYLAVASSPDDLDRIYQQIAGIIQNFSVTDIDWFASLGTGASLVAGSGEPDQPGGFATLTWWRPVVSADATTVRFKLKLSRPGTIQPVSDVWADYIDGDGSRRQYRWDALPTVVVRPAEQSRVFLPMAWHGHCLRAVQGADLVLAIDRSDSMRGEDLARAIDAAGDLIGRLDPARDRVAVVTYDATASVIHPLSSDYGSVRGALGRITSGHGTRLDRGLETAARVALGADHRSGALPVVVLLSDGRQTEERSRAVSTGEIVNAAGIVVFTVALGSDADRELLTSIAGDPDRAFYAASNANLADVYGAVAASLTCR